MKVSALLLVPFLLAAPLHAADLPPDSDYVVARDGDLFLGDRQVRFWGGIGGFPTSKAPGDDIYAYNKKMVDRIEAYGFNMMRIWGYDRTVHDQAVYEKGDGSKADIYDQMIAEAKDRGIRLWLGAAGAGGFATADDVDVIDDAGTAEAWSAGMEKLATKSWRSPDKPVVKIGDNVATIWDPRLEAITIRNTQRLMDHVNQHTGLRVGDDPVFAIWEITNEQWWIVKMVSGKWQTLPAVFKDPLIARWHDFLKEKYGSEKALTTAWLGLLPGENLENGTILLAPLRGESKPVQLNDANPNAEEKFEGEAQTVGRDDFNYARGADVNEFFSGLLLAHKARIAEAFKKNGKAARLSPLLWDTGIGYNGIAQLLHQHADAVSHCTYMGGWTHDSTHRRYPWFSGLEEPPRLGQNVPWIEHNTVEGKPYFVYETQIGSPAKYRAEFPYRMVFIASIQDWDAVCWHTMSSGYKWSESENPFERELSRPGHAASQFNYPFDEVQISAMHAAGQMFINRALDPAPKPTKFIYGRKTLYHPDSMSYAGSYGANGLDMMNTAYRYGSRIEIDLDREDDEIVGPTVPLKGFAYPSPVQPTDQMTYDWNRGFLMFDSPACAAYIGFLGESGSDTVKFGNGVVFSDVVVVNPPDSPFPVTPEENYVAIGLTATDGKPLAECKTAVLSAVSTSGNKGLKVGPDPKAPERPRHAWDGMMVIDNGELPVQVSRVGCTVTSSHIAGMTYKMRDWNWQVIGEGTIGEDGKLNVPADKAVFLVELTRP